MYYAPMPFPVLVLLIVVFIVYMYKTRPKTPRMSTEEMIEIITNPPPEPPTERDRENVRAMERLVAQYEGYSAEVFDIYTSGRRNVETIRLLRPGDEIELRQSIEVFFDVLAFGKKVSLLFVPDTSNLPRIFKEKIPYFAYLGGRSKTFQYERTFDLSRIIVFYKMEGVPPTRVNLIP